MPQPVSATVAWLELPTYVPGPDSPYPAFGWASWRHHYPYSTQLDLSTSSRPVKHRAVVLENKYLRVTVLPDLGGRIFSLYDKTAGHDAFMVPPSIKFQNVSLRGAWIAGGIEMNFGSTHHTAHSVNPITWAVRQDDDGGASVWVGSITRPIEARYAARVRLKPDRAAMDLEIHTHGPLSLPGMMYWWSNAGVQVTQDSRFFYFGKYADSGHGRHSWPVCDGMDFSWYRNRATGSDMFLMETQKDYMAFYDYGRHHGVANTANRFLAPGQKYFTWGNDQRGRFWDLMLSDAQQTYCEIQRGRLPSQGITEPIPATSDDVWVETWMPLAGTEGFSAMANDVVLSVVNEPGQAVLRVLSAVPRERLKLSAALRQAQGDKPLGSFAIKHLQPGKVFTARAKLKAGQTCARARIALADGKVLLDWEDFKFKDEDWFNGSPRQRDQNAPTEELFLEAQRRRTASWPHPSSWVDELYDKVLKQDPGHSGALAAKAEQAVYAGQHQEAVKHLREALKRRPRDPELLAALGWALLRQGQADEAVEPFWQAARYEPGRKLGLTGLACAHLRAARWADALAAAELLLSERPRDLWGRLLKVMALRKLGRADEAVSLLKPLLDEDPLWSRLHAEALLLSVNAAATSARRVSRPAASTSGPAAAQESHRADNSEALLLGLDADVAAGTRKLGDDSVAAAIFYLELALWDDAARVLQLDESNERFSAAVRLAHLLYARHKLGDAGAVKATLKALRLSPCEQANPWAIVSLTVMEELVAAYPDEPMLRLMCGNILGSRHRVDEARLEWQAAADLGLENTVVYRNLALAAGHKKDMDAALNHYRRAWKLSRMDLSCFAELDRLLGGRGLHEERLGLYQQLTPDLRQRSMARMRRVLTLLDTSRYDEALGQLSEGEFLSGEFERTIHLNYVEALMGKTFGLLASGDAKQAGIVMAKGLEYPRNLNVGRSDVWPDEAMVKYVLGLAAEAAGDDRAARRHWLEAATEGHSAGDLNHIYEMLAWLALGRKAKALGIAHNVEKLARKEEPLGPHWHWWYSFDTLTLHYGWGQIIKGRLDEGRGIWEKALADQPDARWFRLHLNIPRAILQRIARQPSGHGTPAVPGVTGPMVQNKPT